MRRLSQREYFERIRTFRPTVYLAWRLLRLVRRLARPPRFLVWHTPRRTLEERLWREAVRRGGVLIDVGCGARRLSANFINVDVDPSKNVDIVASAEALPFDAGVADLIWMEAVLEHLPDPALAVSEATRVLKPGGVIYAEMPFLQGYHAAPNDYQRLTVPGLRHLFRGFEVLDSGVCSGPASTFAYAGCSFCAALLCCGSAWLYKVWFHYVFSYIFFPVKFLDRFLVRWTPTHATAFGHYVLARKPLPSIEGGLSD